MNPVSLLPHLVIKRRLQKNLKIFTVRIIELGISCFDRALWVLTTYN